jgi:phenylacetate-CoA ligase
MEKLIREVFKCAVLNRYGSREVGDVACSCEKNKGLHLNIFNNYVEILNKDLKPCKNGEFGRVYVTTLSNFSMPLIRYDIGDIAVPVEKNKCSCGRGMPLISSVKGRDVNLFKKRDGTLIDGEYFTHLFYFKNWVNKFQVVQKDYDLIEIKVIINGGRNLKEISEMEEDIRKVMGGNCKINWQFVNKIEPNKSGKYLYTISEVV